MLKVDLHTHSQASPDGGITLAQYKYVLDKGLLDVVAITDHNTITFALEAQQQLGDSIIVGEEIMTTEGEIIGLFLNQVIEPMLSPEKTVHAIRSQGGIVYIPHPIETRRKGLPLATMDRLVKSIDIVEVYNGRVMQPSRSAQAIQWAKSHNIAGVASSDAHGVRGWGRAYSEIEGPLTEEACTMQFHNARIVCKDVGIIGRMYPSFHRTRKKFQKHV